MAKSSSEIQNIEKGQQLNKWRTIGIKVKEIHIPIFYRRLGIYGYDSLGQLVQDFIVGKFPQVKDDEQIQSMNNQANGALTQLDGNLRPDFYKHVDYLDMYKYYKDVRKYSQSYSQSLVSYFKKFADTFFTQAELIHQETPHKRAWILHSMRGFGNYYEYFTKGNRGADELVATIIRRYHLNRGLDMRHKINLVDHNYVAEKIKLLLNVPGDLGFVIKVGLLSGLREQELLYMYVHRNKLQVIEKGSLAVIVINRYQATKKCYLTILPMDVWRKFKSLPMFSYYVDIHSAHKVTQQVANVPFKYLRKLHYNVIIKTMSEAESDVMQGRAKTVSAEHYMLYGLDDLSSKYSQAWQSFHFVF